MQNEKERILDMVENGTISAREAVELLKAIDGGDSSREPSYGRDRYRDKRESSRRGFFRPEDVIKKFSKDMSRDFTKDFSKNMSKDFNQLGDRMRDFVQTSVGKLKTMEFDSPFGEAVQFEHTFTQEFVNVNKIIADLANGQLEVFPSQDDTVRAECRVKAYRTESAEQAKQDFLEKFVFIADDQKLRIISDLKTTQVNVVLYVPAASYQEIIVRLFNGGFSMKRIDASLIKVKTANGKIDLKNVAFDDAELETANGAIQVVEVSGKVLETETLNGRIYVDGDVQTMTAKSMNGNVVVTSRCKEARKVEAKTLAGNVELYIPPHLPLKGEVASVLGKLDVLLSDVDNTHEQGQLMQKMIRFSKESGEAVAAPLLVYGETKTGTVLVRYLTIE
ncbi:DUF4097 family beta strand repeat-containing protein [Planomicrobium sp. CPCC 101110]|uniref:DUF4097 family beta strand repeat-containing protein n=1 Tax=Planomicrobium sp. CPCC 101110 TaxID=2599619 RepID=UPI0011B3CF08|nr:DUF4097 family beta strand repeat-containing protein [Planomicrobium sp. CPCC 101110]TWT24310.1 DUF4097 family beta strand repeat protein [Planomicrobium sp. CPCC 101110]